MLFLAQQIFFIDGVFVASCGGSSIDISNFEVKTYFWPMPELTFNVWRLCLTSKLELSDLRIVAKPTQNMNSPNASGIQSNLSGSCCISNKVKLNAVTFANRSGASIADDFATPPEGTVTLAGHLSYSFSNPVSARSAQVSATFSFGLTGRRWRRPGTHSTFRTRPTCKKREKIHNFGINPNKKWPSKSNHPF